MTEALPPRPDLAWLKKAAKRRLTELRSADPSARLNQAQKDIAERYGFASWRALKAHVDGLSLDGQILAAAIGGRADDLARLLDAHPDRIGITGGRWRRPLLHLAAEGGHLDCIECLLDRGFDAQRRDTFDHATALHWAAYGGTISVVRRLVDAGCDVTDDSDAHEMGVLGWATCFHDVHDAVADFLIENGAEPTLVAAIALDRADLVLRLAGEDPRRIARQMSRLENHCTPLHFAVRCNRANIVGLLLDLGADATIRDSRGKTPLGYASAETDPAIVDRLVAAGADPAERSPNRFESAVPILNVRNVTASIAYYVDVLGFEKEWDWGTPPSFASVLRDDVNIFLCQDAQGAKGMWISIFIQDVDALYEDYRKRGAIIRQEPTTFPWGVREMNVEDPDGHRLRIGSDAPGPSDGAPLNEAT